MGCLVLAGNDLGFECVPLRPDTLSDASAVRDVVDGNAALLGDAAQPVEEHLLKLSSSILPTVALSPAGHKPRLRWLDCQQTMANPLALL